MKKVSLLYNTLAVIVAGGRSSLKIMVVKQRGPNNKHCGGKRRF